MIVGNLDITTSEIILVIGSETHNYGQGVVHVSHDHVVIRVSQNAKHQAQTDNSAFDRMRQVMGVDPNTTPEQMAAMMESQARMNGPSPQPREMISNG